MGDFAAEVRRRVRDVRVRLHAAAESGDQYGIQVHVADLEEMLRVAAEHGIEIDSDPDDATGLG